MKAIRTNHEKCMKSERNPFLPMRGIALYFSAKIASRFQKILDIGCSIEGPIVLERYLSYPISNIQHQSRLVHDFRRGV
jgi:hypothetical protein